MSRRLNEFTGVACFAAALLWLVALVSYSPSDPAWFFNSVSGAAPQNFAGRVGAFMAEAGFQLIGYAAFVVPVLLGYIGWHYFWCRDVDAPYTKVIGGSLLVGSVASLLALAFSAFESSARHFRAGGVIGEAIAAGFAVYLNRTGAAILLLTVLALAVVLSTQFSFGQAFSFVAKRVRGQRSLLERFQLWREARQRDRERQQVIDKHVKKTGRENAPQIAGKVADAVEKLKVARAKAAPELDDDEDDAPSADASGGEAARDQTRRPDARPAAVATHRRGVEGAGGAPQGRLRAAAGDACSTRPRTSARSTSGS